MSSLLAALGADPSEFEWQEIASCARIDDPELFFGKYEEDEVIASNVDQICLSCPVAAHCLEYGLENKSYGVWGGIYLSKGKIDDHRNSHKDEQTWERLDKIHG